MNENISQKKSKKITENKTSSNYSSSSPLSNLLKDYSFYRIKNSRTQLFAYLERNKKIYLKGKEAFAEEIYNIALQYSTKSLNIIQEIYSIPNYEVDTRMNESNILFTYLLKNNGIKLIEDITFKPIPERIIEDEKGVYLNEYTPTKYLDPNFNNGCDNENNFPNIRYLLMNLCNNEEKAYEYLLKVLSHSIVNPHIKRHGYIVFQGEGASGKGTFFELIMKPIFEDYCIVDSEEALRTQFNEYSTKAIWLFIEEKEDTRDKGSIASTIKYISGNSKSVSEGKGKDRKVIDDFRNIGFTTNETNPGLDLKEHDRRASIFGYSRALGGNKKNSPQIREKLEQKIPKELENFVSYLKNLQFDIREVQVPYESEARENILKLDKSNVGLFIDEIGSYDLFNHLLEDLNIEFGSLIITKRNNKTYVYFKDIYRLFEQYCKLNQRITTKDNKFSQEFNNITGLKTTSIKYKNKTSKFYELKEFLDYFNLKIDFQEKESSESYNYDVKEIMEEVF